MEETVLSQDRSAERVPNPYLGLELYGAQSTSP